MVKLAFFTILVALGVFGILMAINTTQSQQTPTPTPGITFVPSSPDVTQEPLAASTSATPTKAQVTTASTATITTSKGDIVLEFYAKDAPKTVANFVQKAESGFYDNLTFHRVEDWVVQGGDPKGNGTGGGNMATELNNKPFLVGSLGVARGQDIKISNDAQFFITKKEASWLNGQYTNFGIVKKGMDVVNKIQIGDKILGITVE